MGKSIRSILYTFLFITLIINYSTVHAQVLKSKHLEAVYFGPKNVIGNIELLSVSYVEHFNEAIEELNDLLDENNSILVDLDAKSRLTKKDRRRLTETEKIKESIDYELAYLTDLKRQWNVQLKEQNIIQQAFELQEMGECLEFITNEGIMTSNQLELLKQEEYAIVAKEFITIEETTAATSRWIRKRADRNCLSANPDDCLVWCLVEVPAGYKFKGIGDIEYTTPECPIGMEFNKEKYICYKDVEIIYNQPSASYSLVDKLNQTTYEFLEWNTIECPQ